MNSMKRYLVSTVLLLTTFTFMALLNNQLIYAQSIDSSNISSSSSSPVNFSQPLDNVTIGKLIYQGSGEITSEIVLEGPTIQTSFTSNGTMSIGNLDEKVTEIGTYTTTPRANGILYGEGKGVITGKDNQIVTWTSQEIGTMSVNGTIVFHGSMFFNVVAPVGNLSFLDNMPAVFSFQVDASKNIMNRVWELR